MNPHLTEEYLEGGQYDIGHPPTTPIKYVWFVFWIRDQDLIDIKISILKDNQCRRYCVKTLILKFAILGILIC